MEKKEANKEPFNRPDGVEVKLTAKSINIRGFLFFFILFLIGSYLFVYVWDEPSSYSAGRLLGTSVKGISSPQVMLCILLLLVFYILIQAGILYWFSGKDKKLLHWHFDWTGVGFSLTRPIPLKFYRVSLLLPGILLGVMPAIHGFCTGEANIFFLGLFGILGGTGDFLFWYSLRAFDDEDLLLAGKKAFQAYFFFQGYSLFIQKPLVRFRRHTLMFPYHYGRFRLPKHKEVTSLLLQQILFCCQIKINIRTAIINTEHYANKVSWKISPTVGCGKTVF